LSECEQRQIAVDLGMQQLMARATPASPPAIAHRGTGGDPDEIGAQAPVP